MAMAIVSWAIKPQMTKFCLGMQKNHKYTGKFCINFSRTRWHPTTPNSVSPRTRTKISHSHADHGRPHSTTARPQIRVRGRVQAFALTSLTAGGRWGPARGGRRGPPRRLCLRLHPGRPPGTRSGGAAGRRRGRSRRWSRAARGGARAASRRLGAPTAGVSLGFPRDREERVWEVEKRTNQGKGRGQLNF